MSESFEVNMFSFWS
ncbi:hypothetical protein AB3S75_030716 [Citrus x aurantiifolia]